jgi:nitronate monooxygenase
MKQLGFSLPIVGAPMAGGPSGPELVTAVGKAGGLGFLAAGYKTVEAIAQQIITVRAAGVPYGVNLFAPPVVPVDPAAFRTYAHLMASLAATYGVDVSGQPEEDDDAWQAKLDLLRVVAVPVVSFTFGLPDLAVVRALQTGGTAVLLTVTSADEARLAAALRPDALVVQSAEAGGHLGTFTPHQLPPALPLTDLLRSVRAVTKLPLIGAGGVGTSADVAGAVAAGASAVAVGTALLLADESLASPVHRAALLDPVRTTVVTRAFSGRPARGLRNEFTDAFSDVAPLGYPALHHLTSPIRAAATAAGDPEAVNLWAGTGWRAASTGPAADIVTALTRDI